jgi:hypothetical protein
MENTTHGVWSHPGALHLVQAAYSGATSFAQVYPHALHLARASRSRMRSGFAGLSTASCCRGDHSGAGGENEHSARLAACTSPRPATCKFFSFFTLFGSTVVAASQALAAGGQPDVVAASPAAPVDRRPRTGQPASGNVPRAGLASGCDPLLLLYCPVGGCPALGLHRVRLRRPGHFPRQAAQSWPGPAAHGHRAAAPHSQLLLSGNQSAGHPSCRCSKGQSKPAPGSFLRPGAMCSCPAMCAIG